MLTCTLHSIQKYIEQYQYFKPTICNWYTWNNHVLLIDSFHFVNIMVFNDFVQCLIDFIEKIESLSEYLSI